MINYSYALYVEKTLSLAETMVVKFEDAARAMNTQVMSEYGYAAVDEYDPYSWKYYQNISGVYHFSDKDTKGNPKIKIVSLDTGEDIYFTKEYLALHPATKNNYQYGTRYYKELLIQNPGNEILILGVLYPADIDNAVSSRDGTILSYPLDLVEFNEYHLMERVQQWTYDYLDRWVNRQYCMSDNLYAATYIGQYFLHLTQALFAFRLQACKTNEAHSFHVRNYLASHNNLDVYFPDLTPHQALFFYRNINYIQRHAGKQETFDWLVENIFTHRKLPLYEYSGAQDSTVMIREDAEGTRHLVPDVVFKRKPINDPAKKNGRSVHSLTVVHGIMDSLATGNTQYHKDYYEAVLKQFQYSPSAAITTKVLESQVADYSMASLYSHHEVLMNHWIGLTAKGWYTAQVTFSLPGTGETIKLNPKDAVMVFLYCVHKSNWPELSEERSNVPDVKLSRFIKDSVPSYSALLNTIDVNYINPAELQDLIATAPVLMRIGTSKDFYFFCTKVFANMRQQYLWYSSKERSFSRALAKKAVSVFYTDEVVSFKDPASAPISYTTALYRSGLDLRDYSGSMLYDLAAAILYSATGMEFSSGQDFKRIHASMSSLFTKLSSYSIALTDNANQTEIALIVQPTMRLNDQVVKETQNNYIDSTELKLSVLNITESHSTSVTQGEVFPERMAQSNSATTYVWDPTINIDRSVVQMSSWPQHVQSTVSVGSTFGIVKSIEVLTMAQRMAIKDAYSVIN